MILRSSSYNVYAQVKGQAVSTGSGSGDLADIMTLVIQLKRDAMALTQLVEEAATEAGELQTLIKLRETLEALENGGH